MFDSNFKIVILFIGRGLYANVDILVVCFIISLFHTSFCQQSRELKIFQGFPACGYLSKCTKASALDCLLCTACVSTIMLHCLSDAVFKSLARLQYVSFQMIPWYYHNGHVSQ